MTQHAPMTRAGLAACLDHSVLRPESTAAEVLEGARVAREREAAGYCIQPCWVATAAAALAGRAVRVVAVIGFPHGCDGTASKARVARAAVDAGAHELDMVIHVGALKGGDATSVAAEIAAVVKAAGGAPVKVILETAALTDTEKRLGCRLAVDAGAAFVKTSTGFHAAGGATLADVRLLRAMVGDAMGVKASGGIRTLADALAMIGAGASRVGTSSTAAILDALAP